MPIKNYYTILGVPQNATPEHIKKMYRKQVRQYHPDLHHGAPDARIKLLNEAYGVLSNYQKRAMYDIQLLEEIRDLRILETIREHHLARKQRMTWAQGMVGFVRELKKEMRGS
ncbi:J domain-containing protein [Ktedonospora formicarum]|uniref:J domain-containing protein n=1 Tax=Ktedonospora formicarum TaxID=2778364 RepID=A0A8J3HWS5_9CHLR|nr:DnaJ domain-containing protein [Ktedonospora formicarum]GHO44676.1 hypothetical protein KSX_28390 [Ktedonospora formicarum]